MTKTESLTGRSEYADIEDVIVALRRYETEGHGVGDFLRSVLENDLFKAVAHADGINQKRIPTIVKYIYNRMPMACRGDKFQVRAWQKIGGAKGGALCSVETESSDDLGPLCRLAVDVVADELRREDEDARS